MRRRIAIILSLALLATLVTSAPALADDLLTFPNGTQQAVFGPNAMVRIDGRITYETDCDDPGIPDFFFPATDVYLVEQVPGDGDTLEDVNPFGVPNTIVATTTVFISEVLGATAPGGFLPEGTYHVVYDTCQDGTFDAGQDSVFPDAVTVDLPLVLPPADTAIAEMKVDALIDWGVWMATRYALQKIFDGTDKAVGAACSAGNGVACAYSKLDPMGSVKDGAMALLLSQAHHYRGIAADPPDPDFEQLASVTPVPADLERGSVPTAAAVADAGPALAVESALAEAFLHAIERYQGAQAAGDGRWALVQARQAADLAAALAAQGPATDAALADVRDAVDAAYDEIEGMVDVASDWAWRLHLTSLEPDERRMLRNRGLSPSEITALEAEGRGTQFGLDEAARTDADDLLAALDDVLATRDGFVDAAASVAGEWAALADEVEGLLDADERTPIASAGGPYTVDVGAPLTLDASASTATGDAGALATISWDVDGDGAFDDADGPSPTVSFDTPGSHLVAVHVTDSAGADAVSHTVVQVRATDAPPVIASASPDGRLGEVTVGTPGTFALEVDDEGPVETVWTLDGAQVGDGASFAYDPQPSDVGFHELRATVTDAAGQSVHHAWDVAVELPDADGDGWTATTDCDDADPAVHPGALERPGNGVDDDCDAGTPDAPPGGLVGTVRTWGAMYLGGLGIGPTSTNAHTPQTPELEDAVQVETGFRSGSALLASGEVRAWGSNFNGQVGDGSTLHRSTPQTVVGVDGASTALTGVVEIDTSNSHVLARRSDGTVVGWGDGRNGMLADASNPAARPYPTVQRLADDTPLSGVVAVEAGYSDSYAITDDGRVWSWGIQRCHGGRTTSQTSVPTPLTDADVFDVRQVNSSNQTTLILRRDGAVLSCGSSGPQAGRPVTLDDPLYDPSPVTGLGAGSGAIDIAVGNGFSLALTDDGTVWAWGTNINEQLSAFGAAPGEGWEEPRALELPDGPPVIDVEVGACHSLLRRADGSALQFGCNWLGQSATGDFAPAFVHEVLPEDAVIDSDLSNWNTIALTIPREGHDGWQWPVGYASVSVDDVEVVEGESGNATVTLDQPLPSDVTVAWTVLEGTATADDLEPDSGDVTIPAGATQATFEIATIDDDIDEPDEHFTVALTDAENGLRIDRAQGTGTLLDDDAAPSVSLTPTEVVEGDTSLTDVVVDVSLSHPSSEEIEVAVGTADGSATAPDDYAPADTMVTFEPGETLAAAHVAVRGDLVLEPDETFEVIARDGDGTTLDRATVTIVDDETLTLSSERLVTVDEGTGGTTVLSLPVTVDPAPLPGESVTLAYRVVGDTATVPDDVADAAGTVELTSAAPQATIEIAIVGDDLVEDDEVLRVAFADATASDGRPLLPPAPVTVVVRDDDGVEGSPPSVVLDGPFAGDEGSPIALSATIEDPDGPVAVTWSTDRADCDFADAEQASTSITCADDGPVEVTVTADDGDWPVVTAGTTVQVANVAPTVQLDVAQTDVALGVAISATAAVADPGADDLTLRWSDGTLEEVAAADGTPTAATRTHTFVPDAPGAFEVSVEVTDDGGASARATLLVDVAAPNQAPRCDTVRADPALLWPPDHTFRTVSVVGGTDPDGDPLTLEITGVTQDEPVDGTGDGATGPDARRRADTGEVELRAERAGHGDGRVYRLAVTASDGHGGSCETTVQVGVPKAQSGRHATPIASDLDVDSFGAR